MSTGENQGPAGGTDIRVRLGGLLDQIADDTLKELVEDMMDATKLKRARWDPEPVHCNQCGNKWHPKPQWVQVQYPDLDKRAKILNILLDQGKGKVTETKKVEVSSTKKLEEMTNAELEAFIAGG